MSSLLTFCGQVLLSKAIAFFIQRNLGNVCQRRLFLFTHICKSIRQTQKRTKPPYTFG